MSIARSERNKRIGTSVLGTLAIILLWELASGTVVDSLVLPQPSDIVVKGSRFADLLLPALWSTLKAAAIGYVIAIVLAAVSAIVLTESEWAHSTFMPLVVGGNSVPKVAMAPVMVFYFGGAFGKILVGAWIAFFPMLVNMMEGLNDVDDDLMLLLDSLGGSTRQEYRMVRIPNALPFIFDGLKIGVTLSVIGVITAEFILPQGGASIGGLALLALMNYNTTLAFSVVIMTGFASVTFFFFLFLLQNRVVHWKESTMFSE